MHGFLMIQQIFPACFSEGREGRNHNHIFSESEMGKDMYGPIIDASKECFIDFLYKM